MISNYKNEGITLLLLTGYEPRRYSAKLNLILFPTLTNSNDNMVHPGKIRIRSLNDKSDYEIWRIRVVAVIKAKEYGVPPYADKLINCSDDAKCQDS